MPGGKRLVSVSEDTTASLWEVENHHQVREFARTLNTYFCVAVTPDGQRIAAGTGDGFIRIWDPATGDEMAALKASNDLSIRRLAFLPDGNTLVSSTAEEVRIWRAPSWAEIERTGPR
jgi:WD40 repeat protein